MPKLNGTVAEQVNSAESGSALIEEGTYEMVLIEVAATGQDGKPLVGAAGPYWKWTLAFPEDAPRYAKRRQWVNTSLSADSAWKMKEHFDAFGVPADTDTDDLIGRHCLVHIGTRRIANSNKPEKIGDTVNTVKKLMPLDGVANKAAKGDGSKAKKDLF